MEPEQLFYKLLKAEDEAEVDTILSDQGYLVDDEFLWPPLGGVENTSRPWAINRRMRPELL